VALEILQGRRIARGEEYRGDANCKSRVKAHDCGSDSIRTCAGPGMGAGGPREAGTRKEKLFRAGLGCAALLGQVGGKRPPDRDGDLGRGVDNPGRVVLALT